MKKFLAAAILVLFSSSEALAQSASQSEQAKVFINDIGNKIIKTADDKKSSVEQRKNKIIAIIDGAIDTDWIARFVLGKNYKNTSDENKARFSKLYRDFMINTYGPKFQNYNGRKFDVTDVSEQNIFYIVKAEFLPRDSNTPIDIAFRVKERSGKLMILDFISEGVSLIETQRSEFNSAISQKGMEKFLEDLEVRIKNLKSQK
jgi:phospholipid transport system substrate-binding protein